jgi:hypothetical protein
MRRNRWADGFVYALITTVMLLGTATVLSHFAQQESIALANRVDTNTEHIVQEVVETKKLLCDILRNAQTKEVREAVRTYCPEAIE